MNKYLYTDILNLLKNEVDWERHARRVQNISCDKNLNVASNRFDKSDILCHILEKELQHKDVKYVDRPGYDFEHPNFKMEDKTENMFFFKKRFKKNIDIMLKNTMGAQKKTKKEFIDNLEFDLLLLRQTDQRIAHQYVGAIDPRKILEDHINFTGDQIKLKVPLDMIDWIHKPETKNDKHLSEQNTNIKMYSDLKKKFQSDYIDSIL